MSNKTQCIFWRDQRWHFGQKMVECIVFIEKMAQLKWNIPSIDVCVRARLIPASTRTFHISSASSHQMMHMKASPCCGESSAPEMCFPSHVLPYRWVWTFVLHTVCNPRSNPRINSEETRLEFRRSKESFERRWLKGINYDRNCDFDFLTAGRNVIEKEMKNVSGSFCRIT